MCQRCGNCNAILRLEGDGNGKIGTENIVMANIVQTLNFLGSEFVLYNNQLLMLCIY